MLKEPEVARNSSIDCQREAQSEKQQPFVSPCTEEVGSKQIVYLTLGDGDFTYSLDLARFLKLSAEDASPSSKQKPVKLILTGVDTLEELVSKYKDAPSTLQQIRNEQSETPLLSLTIRHGVNAIFDPSEKHIENVQGQLHEAAHHVLFHHPHLGTENCTLHKHFLAHLFYSVETHWMRRNGGIFHLTLVQGQYERWRCQEQAERHGLTLLQKSPFAPPPLKKLLDKKERKAKGTTNCNRYHYRRHQTGKSFATRRPNSKSITYTFGRKIDKEVHIATALPWQSPLSSFPDTSATTCTKEQSKSENPLKLSMFSCRFCDKEFLEKRSLKCHLRDKHSSRDGSSEQEVTEPEQPRKKTKLCGGDMSKTIKKSEISMFSCFHCEPKRIFQSEKALQSHIRAKHSGLYTYIAPDWSKAKTKESREINECFPGVEVEDECNECRICGFKLLGRNLSLHFRDFLPVDALQTYRCDFCSKLFREERAKLQHTNFCSKRSD